MENLGIQALDRLAKDIEKAIDSTDWKQSNGKFVRNRNRDTGEVEVHSVTFQSAAVQTVNGLWLTVRTSIKARDIGHSLKCPLLFVSIRGEPGSTQTLASVDARRLFWAETQPLLEITEKLHNVAKQKIARHMCELFFKAPVSERQQSEEQALLALFEHGCINERKPGDVEQDIPQFC